MAIGLGLYTLLPEALLAATFLPETKKAEFFATVGSRVLSAVFWRREEVD